MADNRLPNMAGQAGMQQSAAFNPMLNMGMGPMGQPMFANRGSQQPQQFGPGMPFYPQQGMNPSMMTGMPGAMAPAMFPMQSMRPPGGPPPPYTQQLATSYHNKTRAPSAAAAKSSNAGAATAHPKPKTEKERYFEEQQKKLRQFHRPGAPMTDANTLVENLFGKTEKHGSGHGAGSGSDRAGHHHHHHKGASQAVVAQPPGQQDDDDDGFGDFLGGPTSTAMAPLSSASSSSSLSLSMANAGSSSGADVRPPSAVTPPSLDSSGGATKAEQLNFPEPKSPIEKKDLMSMMMECSDLNTPQKAKGFHKPSLMEVQKSGAHHSSKNVGVHHESDHARRWDNTQELEGLFIVERKAKPAPPQSSAVPPQSPTSPTTIPAAHAPPHHPLSLGTAQEPQAPTVLASAAHSGTEGARTLPDWCQDSGKNLPVVYQHVLEAVSEGETIVTERLYPILLMSGLQREALGRLWNLANTHTPGHLTRPELWILLALVALVQNKYEVTSTAILKRCPQAPVPFLGQPSSSQQAVSNAPPSSGTLGQLSTSAGPVSGTLAQASASATPVSAGYDGHGESVGDHCSGGVTSHAVVSSQPFPTSFHQPVPSSVSGANTVSPQVAILPTSGVDDEFADFQTAPTPALKHPPSLAPRKTSVTRTDDSYGEFIGGNSSLSSEQSLSSVPKEAADRLEKLYSNGGMTADEQYNSNVRNFFCSSDSSTAKDKSAQKVTSHTTPNSMDDEDFTDGHDSMSQVSTSEQSENEDIRAFENYVQEFNRKKDAQVSSDSLVLGTLPGSPGRGKMGQKPGRGASSKDPAPSAVVKTPPAVHFPIPGPPGPITSFPATSAVNLTTAAVKREAQEDDFADFKSASDVAASGKGGGGKDGQMTKVESSGDMVLLGEEDKYSALRSLTTGVPSLFEKQSDADGQSLDVEPTQEENEEWADFSSAVHASSSGSAAPGVAELSVSETQSFPGHGVTTASSDVGGKRVEAGGSDEWADFATAKSVAMADSLSISSIDSGKVSAPNSNASWSGFSSGLPAGAVGSKAASDHANLPPGNVSDNASRVEESGDDWADFATAKPTTSEDGLSGKPSDWQKGIPGSGLHMATSNTFTVIDTDRGGFSSPHMTTTSSEVFTGPDQSAAVLTVKKQNLETSEIMSVFKMRDDPTIMLSYELPRQTLEQPKPAYRHHHAYRSRRSRSHSGGKDHEMSPDAEDYSMGPPPLDSVGDDEDEQEFSRGYDLDDIVHQPVPTTVYSPFGFPQPGSGYTRSAFTAVTKTSSSVTNKDRPTPTITTEGRPHSLSPDSGETDSLSNRVSSLREDSQSVSSLDLPASKISSLADAQRDSDSQSVSSMEFGGSIGGVEGGGGGGVVVRGGGEGGVSESKSLDSLDLRSGGGGVGGGGGGEEEEEEENDGRWGRYGSQPPAPPPVMGPAPILTDRYNLDGQQVEGSERYAFEWERCLASSCRHISGANNIFNTISSSAVCNEVLRSPQGSDYVLGLIEVYRVVRRIMTSLPTTAVTSSSIEQSLKQIDLAWNNLTAFLVGASLLPDEMTFTFKQAVLKSDSPAAQLKACGVCLLDVDYRHNNTTTTTTTITGTNGEATPKLSYGGRQYHAPCANFWVNCVDSMLPALKLPELL